jgi:twitching motility protein PilT
VPDNDFGGSTLPVNSTGRKDHAQGADPELITALQAVLQFGASDLHISVDAPPMLRVDGALRPLAGAKSWSAERVSTALRSILTPYQWERFSAELELDFSFQLSENARFRVNFYQQRLNLGAAFRIIPTEIKPLSELGLPKEVGKLAALSRGLVLVTGPTGSGKSTTLAALVEMVNATRTDHIVTVEDPIEFLYTNKKAVVNQREVGHDTHSFTAALKHVLRQDPDVILIGELRDLETISVALTAAETGHLVFATLHTQDASQTIDRVIDVFPPHQQNQVRAQLAATLQGVICQTLIKRMNGSGRVVATEVMFMTPAISNLIREGKAYQIPSAMQAGGEKGMHTMDQSLAELVNSGTISLESAMLKVVNLEVLKRLVTRESAIAQPFGHAVHDLDISQLPLTGSMGTI